VQNDCIAAAPPDADPSDGKERGVWQAVEQATTHSRTNLRTNATGKSRVLHARTTAQFVIFTSLTNHGSFDFLHELAEQIRLPICSGVQTKKRKPQNPFADYVSYIFCY
jgi:hypothetical protein